MGKGRVGGRKRFKMGRGRGKTPDFMASYWPVDDMHWNENIGKHQCMDVVNMILLSHARLWILKFSTALKSATWSTELPVQDPWKLFQTISNHGKVPVKRQNQKGTFAGSRWSWSLISHLFKLEWLRKPWLWGWNEGAHRAVLWESPYPCDPEQLKLNWSW